MKQTTLEKFLEMLEERNTHLCIPGNPNFNSVRDIQARMNASILSTFEERLDYNNALRATWIYNRMEDKFHLNQIRIRVQAPKVVEQHGINHKEIVEKLKTKGKAKKVAA